MSAPLRHVYRWDLDKTYLRTNFKKMSRMVKLAFEKPEHKVNVPGSAALLRQLSEERDGQADSRICIVSGSPRQMRSVLEKKLRLDGVRWDEFHLKPQWENLKRGRFRAVRDQIGYKLPLLLEGRLRVPPDVRESLFGDDAEADAFVYSLYADLVAGRVATDELSAVMRAAGGYAEDIERCVDTARQIEPFDAVERIFIHLDERTPPAFFRPFGSRVVPVYNYFQAALVLFAGGHIDAAGVIAVTRAFLRADKQRPQELANCFQDIVRRGHLPGQAMQELAAAIQEHAGVQQEAEVIWLCIQAFTDLGPARHYLPPAPPPGGNYRGLLERLKKVG